MVSGMLRRVIAIRVRVIFFKSLTPRHFVPPLSERGISKATSIHCWGLGEIGANEGLIRGHGLGDFDGDDGHVIAGWEAEGIESIA